MSERMSPEAHESRPKQEIIAETLKILQEEYSVLALDRTLQMTEVEYLKMVDIKNRTPDLDGYEEGTLGEEVILGQLLLLEAVNDSLNEMEEYFRAHGDKWKDMTS